MKRRNVLTLVIVFVIIASLVTSCSSEVSINPKLKGDRESGYAGTIGNKMKPNSDGKYSGYLGYGYNIVKSGYFNSSDVNTKALIINMDSLVKEGLVYSSDKSLVETALYMGTTINEYQSQVSTQIGLSASYGLFSTSVSLDFSLSETSSTTNTSKNVYIKNQIKIQKERQYIDTSSMSYKKLKKYANKAFLDELNKDVSSITDATEKQNHYNKLFDTYGTHVMIDIVLGGRMDLNYVYNNSESKTMHDIKTEVNAAYKTLTTSVSGSVSNEISTKAANFVSNTTFTGKRIGGSRAGEMSTYEEAKASYKEWAQSIEDNKSIELIDVGDSCETSLVGLWEFADSDEKRTEIFDAYNRYLQAAGSLFAEIDSKSSPVTYYVKDIYIGSHKNSSLAVSHAESKITADNPNALYKIIKNDLNRGCGGDFIYLAYTLTTNKDEAITDVKIEWWSAESNAKSTYNYNGITYNCIKDDLNKGAGGKFIYLYYTRDKKAGKPLTDLGVETNGSYSFGATASGWSVVTGLTENSRQDCNRGSGGAYIYIWQKR